MVHGLFEVGDVALVDLGDGLVVLGCHREPPHVRVYVDSLHQASGRLCNCGDGGAGGLSSLKIARVNLGEYHFVVMYSTTAAAFCFDF